MKIVYMGTPDFAVPALVEIHRRGHEIGYVVSQPDRAKDRGKKIKPTPVKEKAQELGLNVLQPESIKDNNEFYRILLDYEPDLIVVAAYGKIIPKDILEIPKYGCVNIHGSILPRWRGAAPIQWAIISGDTKTGVTLMYMSEGLDTGDMIAKKYVEIDRKTSGELHDELAVIGAQLLGEKLDDFENGNAIGEKQDDSLSCYAPMLSKKDGEIDFSLSAEKIECAVRGLNPWPGAYTYLEGNIFKIWEADFELDDSDAEFGSVISADENGIKIATGKGILIAKTVQVPGKKKMSVKDYLRGNKIEKNTVFGK